MKTRTLLLLSVGVGLAILVAGGVLLLQLSNETAAVEQAEIGEQVRVGDASVRVLGVDETGPYFTVDVELGGVDDDLSGFSLATGDARVAPETTSADGRCTQLTVAEQRCRIEFDLSGTEGSNRVLVLRRGDQQRNWVLAAP
jgi:hypothetical protein